MVIGMIAAAASMAACGGANSATGPGSVGGAMAATINGQSFQASVVSAHVAPVNPDGQHAIEIVGVESCSTGGPLFNIQILRAAADVAAGTYQTAAGNGTPSGIAKVTMNMNANTPGGADAWEAVPGGVVTITSVSGSNVSGTFHADLNPTSGNKVGGARAIRSGTFTAPISNRPIC